MLHDFTEIPHTLSVTIQSSGLFNMDKVCRVDRGSPGGLMMRSLIPQPGDCTHNMHSSSTKTSLWVFSFSCHCCFRTLFVPKIKQEAKYEITINVLRENCEKCLSKGIAIKSIDNLTTGKCKRQSWPKFWQKDMFHIFLTSCQKAINSVKRNNKNVLVKALFVVKTKPLHRAQKPCWHGLWIF